jgi:hypothetical protein
MPPAERTVPFLVALRPRTMPGAFPPAQRVIRAYQEHLLAELRAIDEQASTLAGCREAIVAELRRCRDARGWVDMQRRRAPLPGDIDAEPDGTRRLDGADLRDAVLGAVYAAGRPVAVTEIHRMLMSCGVRAGGEPSKSISNALRSSVAAGVVGRVAKGVYAATRGTGGTEPGAG